MNKKVNFILDNKNESDNIDSSNKQRIGGNYDI